MSLKKIKKNRWFKVGVVAGFILLLLSYFNRKKDINSMFDMEDEDVCFFESELDREKVKEEGESMESENGNCRNVPESAFGEYSTDEITKEIAKDFVVAYHTRCPDYDYLKIIKKYTTKDYYDFLSQKLERQTLGRTWQLVMNFSIVPTADKKTSTHVTWAVFVDGVQFSQNGERKEKKDMYVVTLKRKSVLDEWKVSGSWMNIAQ